MSEHVLTVQDFGGGWIRVVKTNIDTKKSTTVAKLSSEGALRSLIGSLSEAYIERFGGDAVGAVDSEFESATHSAHEHIAHVFAGTGDGHGFVSAVKAYDAYLRANPPLPDNVVPIDDGKP